MIESIHIVGTASYANPVAVDGLARFNFFFGANGSGKTTISRVIGNESAYAGCSIKWRAGTRIETLVYNQDFVNANFNQSADLKGIFTLGEKNVETLRLIGEAKNEIDGLTQKIEGLTLGLEGEDGTGGKKGELAALEAAFKETCWVQKQKHDAVFKEAFEGYRSSAERFKEKMLGERKSNAAALCDIADMRARAATVFGPPPVAEPTLALLDGEALIALESAPILAKRVVGKEDVDVAALITTLRNSDWVRAGRQYLALSSGACPFCQQATGASFAESLADYFDEAFEADTNAIKTFVTQYSLESRRVQQAIQALKAAPGRFLDVEGFSAAADLFNASLLVNSERIAAKEKEASRVVQLESLAPVIEALNALVATADDRIAEHNHTVANVAAEKAILVDQVWRYLIDVELRADINVYEGQRAGLVKALASMGDQIDAAGIKKAGATQKLHDLERQTTSVQPTITAMNAVLKSFGFAGFSLATAGEGRSYKLVRQDGSDARATLSEGERNFVTFLYFYHLLKGSDSESGVTTDRIVVFDDPVSSLDSDVLFIVGSLIKGLFREVRDNLGHIKQVFVLTHNVYFHKEVSFNPDRRDRPMRDETFWVVRKPALVTNVERQDSNPIKTSYELLWAEVRRPDRSTLTIQNTLRRILENYFKILGGIDPDTICSKFDGKERLHCKSLFSWVNDGSHSAHDDAYFTIDDSAVDAYLAVFRAIFVNTGHLGHYKMMMGDAYAEVEIPEKTAPVASGG